MSINPNRRLKQILAKHAVLEPADLDAAVATAESEKQNLVDVVVAKHQVDPADVLAILSAEIGFPPLDLQRYKAPADIADYFPQELAEKHGVCPLSKIGNCLSVAMPDPFDIVKLDQLKLETRMEIRPVVALAQSVKEGLQAVYGRANEMADLLENMSEDAVEAKERGTEDGESLELDLDADAAPAVKLVNMMIYNGVRDRASDIHIEPFERHIRVRFRMDGVCKEVLSPPKSMQAALVSRIKIMCGLDIAERRKPQDGKFQVKVEGRQVDFRVSTLPMVHGEKVVMRILDGGNLALSLDSLGFEQQALDHYRHAIAQPYGMILITGPTGSGKSTTLYSALKEIYSPEVNITTVEDPVEYQLDGINQVPVNPKRGLTFAAALRSILRQDPDTVLIGEIRDKETVEIAVKAALTGHLVLSTLHTNDAPSTITRMVDMGLDPFLVSSSVILICAQRLMRKICDNCKTEIENPPHERLLEIGFRDEDFPEMQIFEANVDGCNRCAGGYKGRFAVLETMPMTDALRRLVIDGRSSLEIKAKAIEEQMITLRRSAILNCLRGRTSPEEVLRVTLAD